ncbi:hypothetical protein BST81_00385 [Leptolyngbya sp. 'hensonii']|nr:hypothetical protein BST81_00385 [Leptolyngbya sp. 'hensonii']
MVRMQVKELLPQNKFEFTEAADGVEGFSLICQEHPNLVLLDFFMPRMNGWEVLQKVRALPELHSIPIVVMTGRKEEVLQKVPDLFDYYACIEKPFEQKTLVESVRSAMAKVKARQAPPTAAPPTATPTAPPTATPTSQPPISSDLPEQVKLLQAQVDALTTSNVKLQAEVSELKKQVNQIVGFIRQKMQ